MHGRSPTHCHHILMIARALECCLQEPLSFSLWLDSARLFMPLVEGHDNAVKAIQSSLHSATDRLRAQAAPSQGDAILQADILVEAGYADLSLRAFDHARSAFLDAEKLCPDHYGALVGLAACLFEEGNLPECHRALDRAADHAVSFELNAASLFRAGGAQQTAARRLFKCRSTDRRSGHCIRREKSQSDCYTVLALRNGPQKPRKFFGR